MLEILSYLVIGYFIYKLISAWLALQTIKQAVNEVIDKQLAVEKFAQQTVVAKFEAVDQGPYSVVLIYDQNTNKFLGQAATQLEAEQFLKKRYPAKNIVIATDQTSNYRTLQTVDTKSV